MKRAGCLVVVLWVSCFFGSFVLASPLSLPEKRTEGNVKQAEEQVSDLGNEHGIQMVRGEILRFYEERSGEWSSYVLVRDFLGQDWKFFVHPSQTLVQYQTQALELEELTGGMKVTVLCRRLGNVLRASVVRIDGMIHG